MEHLRNAIPSLTFAYGELVRCALQVVERVYICMCMCVYNLQPKTPVTQTSARRRACGFDQRGPLAPKDAEREGQHARYSRPHRA